MPNSKKFRKHSKSKIIKRGRIETYAIESVAEPFPALASTTSVPPSWVRLVSATISSSDKFAFGVAYFVNFEIKGKTQLSYKVEVTYNSLKKHRNENYLGQQREDGYASMTANHGDNDIWNKVPKHKSG